MTILDDLDEENSIDEILLRPMMTFIKEDVVFKVFSIKGLL